MKNKNMMLTEDMRAVIIRIHKTAVSPNRISPNFVNELANKMGRELTSEQAVYISDNMGYNQLQLLVECFEVRKAG